MKKYYVFLDESGDHDLTYVDENFPIFLLSATIFEEGSYNGFVEEINQLKIKYFGTDQVILHSRDIRKCEGAFKILFDLEVKENFYKDLNAILNSTKFRIIGSAINKEEHIKQYGKSAVDPYDISLVFVMERLIHITKNDSVDVSICIEKRGKKEDSMLPQQYNRIVDRGTWYVDSGVFKEKITEFKFNHKYDNIVGLQAADLCAYPVARFIINPKMPNPAFEVLKDKLCKDNRGKILGFGLKVFPISKKSHEGT